MAISVSPADHASTPQSQIPPDTGMLDTVRNLTDVGAMNRYLHECIALERNIDAELDHHLTQRHDLEKRLSSLYKSSEVLAIVHADASSMLASVASTCALAEGVSSKVRELDLAQSRVQETTSRIEAIVDRSRCIEGVKQALEVEDFEAAAKYVDNFLNLDEEYSGTEGQDPENKGSFDTSVDQRKQLLESKQKLDGMIRKKFAVAVEERNHENAVRFAQLFVPLRLHEEGLKLYVGYLRKAIGIRARNDFEGLMETVEKLGGVVSMQKKADFVGVINDLFKGIALAIEENEDLLKAFAGEDGIAYAIKDLQEECDTRGSVTLKKYIEYRKLGRLAKEIAARHKNLLAVGSQEGPDPREVEIFLEEMLLLIQTSEDYTQFMVSKLREAGSAGAQLSPRATVSLRSGSFTRAVQELTGYYVILEEFFMVENVRKALKIDELIPDSLTTSMVDDVFFVLQSCSRRAICTSNIQLVLSTVNCAIDLLNNEFRETLQRKTREPNLASKLFMGGVGVVKIGTEVATALNNVDVSAEYTLKLRHEIEEQCNEVFPASTEKEKLKACLAALGEASAALRQLVNTGLEQLANSITPRLRSTLDAVGVISYEITEAQYAENEVNDPWVQKLLLAVEDSINWLQPLLTADNYDSLVHFVIDFIVKRLEVVMMQKRFNQLGGLQLDRDVRTMVGHFSGMTQRTVRDKFARLTQMATILNLEKVLEILDYWGENSGPMTWRLTPAEVRRILSLRMDFKQEAIAGLKL